MQMKGTPVFYGHRAFGSQFRAVLLLLFLVALYLYLFITEPNIAFKIYIYNFQYNLYFIILVLILIVLIYVLIQHYRWTFAISTSEIYVKKGIIASDVKSFQYTNIQEIKTFQTVGQRILLYGSMKITMLVAMAGQSTPEEASMPFIHRPRYIARKLEALK